MNKGGLLSDVLDTVKDETKAIARTAKTQVTGEEKEKTASQVEKKEASSVKSQSNPEETKKIVKHLYGADAASVSDAEKQQKEARDKQKEQDLLKQLHDESYYQPLVNPAKQQEEKPAEKIEREKMEELQQEEEKEKKKPKPLAVQMEQSKAERSRGVSG